MSLSLFLMALMFQRNQVEESMKVEYVVLDVMAYRGDQMVTDLTIADFEVFENKKKVDFEMIEKIEYQVRGEEIVADVNKISLKQSDAQRATPAYQMVFALDLAALNPTQKRKAIDQLDNTLVELNSRPNVAIYIYSMTHGKVTKGFASVTEAREDLATLKDRVKRRRPSRRERNNRPDLTQLESSFDFCRQSFGGQKSRRGEMERCIQAELDVFVDQEIATIERIIGELQALTQVFRDVKGPKFIYFVSPGFSLKPGRAATQVALQYTAERGVHRSETFEREFRQVTHACIRNRIVFNTFDVFTTTMERDRYISPELTKRSPDDRTQVAWRGYRDSLVDGMTTLADESGGVFHDGLNMTPAVLQTIDRSRMVYVLGYKSPKGKKGKFRKIRVKCKRSGVKLKYRQGYFGS